MSSREEVFGFTVMAIVIMVAILVLSNYAETLPAAEPRCPIQECPVQECVEMQCIPLWTKWKKCWNMEYVRNKK